MFVPSGLSARHFLHLCDMKGAAMTNFYEYIANGDKDLENKTSKPESVVQDQDTVIGDAMCHASQIIYDCAYNIANCINENNQSAIDIQELQKAERALCYMEGVVFGLAMDDKRELWYMTELNRCMASIEMSRENGFQSQIYLPQPPWDVLEFDELHCRNNPVTFLRIDLSRTPRKEYVDMRKEEFAKDPHYRYLFEKGILDPLKFPEAHVTPKVSVPDADEPAPAEDEKNTEDDSQSVLNLRNLYRQSKINKGQYIGGLATLVATGLISKSEFSRLKAAAN